LSEEIEDIKQQWHWASIVTAVVMSVISGAAIQFLLVTKWTGTIEEKVSTNEAAIRDVNNVISRFDVQGTRTVPVITERITALEKLDTTTITRIDNISARLDNFIQQVNRLETPLSKKVEGLEMALMTLRDATNVHTASATSRFEIFAKRQDQVFEKLSFIDKEFVDVRNRLGTLDGQARELKNLSDARQLVVQRAERGFEDIALLKQQIDIQKNAMDNEMRRFEERQNRIVSALDTIHDLLQQHLRQMTPPTKKK
jgi:chromosome segregation ATPase